MTDILGIPHLPISEYAVSANAILGTRDSGKTYTATKAAEELFDAGIPFIALDPIGVWHSLRIAGKGKGYPVVVAGGRHGDLPLTVKTAGKIVRAAMEGNISLVLDLFSVDLSKADWRKIVRETCEILLHENLDHGLRHIFIEEAAEFVPQRVQDGLVFSAVEKVVRMGGNSKLGVTLVNQRSADLNKSVLELCSTVLVHRQVGKNTIMDLRKWMDMLNLSSSVRATIDASLPKLDSGQCWVLSTVMPAPWHHTVPEKNSQHPDRRAATVKGAKRKPVDASAFVKAMKSALEEKAPAAAPAKILEKQRLVQAGDVERAASMAFEDGFRRGHRIGFHDGVAGAHNALRIFLEVGVPYCAPKDVPLFAATPQRQPIQYNDVDAQAVIRSLPKSVTGPRNDFANGLKGPERRIIDSLATWRVLGNDRPTNAQVAWLARYSPSSTSYTNPRSALHSAGLIHYPENGFVALTAAGEAHGSRAIEIPDGILSYVLAQLPGPEARILRSVARWFPESASNAETAYAAGYSESSTSYTNPRSALRSKDLITYPAKDMVRAADWLFEGKK